MESSVQTQEMTQQLPHVSFVQCCHKNKVQSCYCDSATSGSFLWYVSYRTAHSVGVCAVALCGFGDDFVNSTDYA